MYNNLYISRYFVHHSMNATLDEAKWLKKVIKKMVNNNTFNAKHSEYDTVFRAMKRNCNKKVQVNIEKFVKKSGFFEYETKTSEKHIWLLSSKSREIKEFLNLSVEDAIKFINENI